MNRRSLTARLALSLGLVAALAAGCSRSEDAAQKPSSARPLSQVWADVLAQRDIMQTLMGKALEEVTHEDCAALGAAARRIDQLTEDLAATVPALPEQSEGQLRATGDAIMQLKGAMAKIRESALAEAPGQWVHLRFPLDRALRVLESYFPPEQLGPDSVTSRPNYESKPQPPPLSPI